MHFSFLLFALSVVMVCELVREVPYPTDRSFMSLSLCIVGHPSPLLRPAYVLRVVPLKYKHSKGILIMKRSKFLAIVPRHVRHDRYHIAAIFISR
jgi:hypothetical protein